MDFETHQKDLSHRSLASMSGIVPRIQINPSHRNTWLDFALVLISLTTIMSAYMDTPVHIWLASGMAVLVLVHLVFHWTWIQTTGKNIFHKKTARIWSKIILNVALLIDFLLLGFSGLIISTIYAPHITQFHILCFYTFMNLLTIHLFLNRKWKL